MLHEDSLNFRGTVLGETSHCSSTSNSACRVSGRFSDLRLEIDKSLKRTGHRARVLNRTVELHKAQRTFSLKSHLMPLWAVRTERFVIVQHQKV
jgi:hypothetical protein